MWSEHTQQVWLKDARYLLLFLIIPSLPFVLVHLQICRSQTDGNNFTYRGLKAQFGVRKSPTIKSFSYSDVLGSFYPKTPTIKNLNED